jgi:plasmid stability protein
MTLTIELPDNLDAALQIQARAKGISAASLARQVLEEALTSATIAVSSPELPILHLGAVGELHRRDIYSDVR